MSTRLSLSSKQGRCPFCAESMRVELDVEVLSVPNAPEETLGAFFGPNTQIKIHHDGDACVTSTTSSIAGLVRAFALANAAKQ